MIIGDQLANVQPHFMLDIINKHMRKTVRPFVLDEIRIEINDLTVNPALVGAAAVAAQEIYKEPFRHLDWADSVI